MVLLALSKFGAAQEPIKVEHPELPRHYLGSQLLIHSKEKTVDPRQDYVKLQVIVDTEGNVEAADRKSVV